MSPLTFQKTGIQIDWTGFDVSQPFTVPLNSSCIQTLHHNPLTGNTEVYFTDGMEYEYYDIPISVILEWIQSSSVGRYFNYHIRDNYSYSQIG